MKRHLSTIIALLVVQAMIAVPFGIASQTPRNGGQTGDITDSGWPRTITSGAAWTLVGLHIRADRDLLDTAKLPAALRIPTHTTPALAKPEVEQVEIGPPTRIQKPPSSKQPSPKSSVTCFPILPGNRSCTNTIQARTIQDAK